MSTTPPFSDEQLAWLRSKFAPTSTPTDPPADDPPSGNGSSDNGKLNSHKSSVMIYVQLEAYPNPTIGFHTPYAA